MKRLILVAIMLSIALYSQLALAAPAWVTISNPAKFEIYDSLVPGVTPGLYFSGSGFTNPMSCQCSTYVSITDTDLARKALALALYAAANGKGLSAYVSSCNGVYMIAHAIMMQ